MNSFTLSPLRRPDASKDGFQLKLKALPGNENTLHEFIEDMRRAEVLIMLAEAGSDADIKKMRKILNEDPKRQILFKLLGLFVLSMIQKIQLIEKTRRAKMRSILPAKTATLAQFSFYLATMPIQRWSRMFINSISQVTERKHESPLDVAVRWGH